MKYFNTANTLEELKAEYRRLALENHPDMGGKTETMQEINAEFDLAFRILEKKAPRQNTDTETETPTEYRRQFYTQSGWVGSRYNPHLGMRDIATIVRGYVKDVYPTWKFSVRLEWGATSCAIRISAMEGPAELFSEAGIRKWAEKAQWKKIYQVVEETLTAYQEKIKEVIHEGYFQNWEWYYDYMTDTAREVLSDIEKLVTSYRYDDSDAMCDYFDTNFYTNFYIGKWDKHFKVVPRRERIQTAHGPKKARRIAG